MDLKRFLSGRSKAKAKVISFEELVIREAFDVPFYLDAYPDVAASGGDPVKHYIAFGWREGRNPCANFHTKYYLENNEDVREAGINPFFHFIAEGAKEGRSGIPPEGEGLPAIDEFVLETVQAGFDQDFYLANNPDVAIAEIDPLIHYLSHGWKERRDPSETFSVGYYLDTYADVAESGVEPYFHYLVQGKGESRRSQLDTNAAPQESDESADPQRVAVSSFFDKDFYLRTYPDVADAGIDPLDHYLAAGWQERRDPSPHFSTKYYLDSNPDVASAGMNPLLHYVLVGKQEGRHCRHPGGYRAEILKNLPSLAERTNQAREDVGEVVADDKAELDAKLFGLRRSVVLSLSHDVYMENVGGVQACILEEQSLLSSTEFAYVHISPVQPLPTLAASDDVWIGSLTIDGIFCGRYTAEEMLNGLEPVLSSRETYLILHALHGHAPEWVAQLATRVKPCTTYYWVHDYFSLCVGFNLLRNDLTYCNAPAVDSSACQLCVYGEARVEHLRRIRALFEAVPITAVAPSQFALELWKEKADLPYVEAIAHPHRRLIPRGDGQPPRCNTDQRLNVAFLGHPALHKGWPAFKELVYRFEDDHRYRFYHLGQGGDSALPVEYVPVRVTSGDRSAMQRILAECQIDLVLVLSAWPETFCLTAYEAMAAGAFVVATSNGGNVVEMVREAGRGLVVDSDEDLFRLFEGDELGGCISDARRCQRPLGLASSGVSVDLIQAARRKKDDVPAVTGGARLIRDCESKSHSVGAEYLAWPEVKQHEG